MSESVLERKMLLGGDWVEGKVTDQPRRDGRKSPPYRFNVDDLQKTRHLDDDIRTIRRQVFLSYSDEDNAFIRKIENRIDVQNTPVYPKWLITLFAVSLTVTVIGLAGLITTPFYKTNELVLASLLGGGRSIHHVCRCQEGGPRRLKLRGV